MNLHKQLKKLKVLVAGAIVAATLIGTTVSALASDYLWPTPGIDYWYRGFGKNGHQGMDIAANDWEEIFAAGNGTVMEVYTGCNNYDGADTATGGVPCNQTGKCNPSKSFYKDGFCNSAYGNAVIIKHDTGIWSAYAHLVDIAKGIKVGTRVTAGQLVGYSGSTGRSTGVHLHFEMRSGKESYFWLNKAFDPLTLVGPEDINGKYGETQAPEIYNAYVYNVTSRGYWVSCEVTDNVEVDYVAFPTWTALNGQDDLKSDWKKNYIGSNTGDTWRFYVSIADHNMEAGVYNTHIYAYDINGNRAALALNPITVETMQPGQLLGDVDFNGIINASDALLILQKSAGIQDFDYAQMQVGDITCDGFINASDALRVLEIAAGM